MFSYIQQLEYAGEYAALKAGHNVACSLSIVKLITFVGTDRLLRVSGRLQYSDLTYDEKHPIILPTGHLSLLLVQYQHVLLKHAGVEILVMFLSGGFWIVGLRCLAKRVK